mmetsp:Transcript_38001/g.104508  ORF Transcript_38001/g.104508 Transcript_38001/m.104508 type:complete len:202 (+) Transcript_38001:732-1337(+)
MVRIRLRARRYDGFGDMGNDSCACAYERRRRRRYWQCQYPAHGPASPSLTHGTDGTPVSDHARAPHLDQGDGSFCALVLLCVHPPQRPSLRIRRWFQADDQGHGVGREIFSECAWCHAHALASGSSDGQYRLPRGGSDRGKLRAGRRLLRIPYVLSIDDHEHARRCARRSRQRGGSHGEGNFNVLLGESQAPDHHGDERTG